MGVFRTPNSHLSACLTDCEVIETSLNKGRWRSRN